MSQHNNTALLERAAECIDYFYGKLPATLIEQDIDNSDFENLSYHVKQAEAEISRQEFHNYNVLDATDAY